MQVIFRFSIRAWSFGLYLLLLNLTSSGSLACIGDNKKQLVARYGVAKEAGYENIYMRDPWVINVFFDKDQKSAMEVFSKRVVDPRAVDNPVKDGTFVGNDTRDENFANQPDLTPQEIDQILKDNRGDYGWGGMRTGDGADYWYRGDRKIIAQYKKKEKALVLMSITQ